MNKKLVRIIGILLILAIGGGGVAWFVTTAQTKQSVIDTITKLNATTAEDGTKIEISYASVETAGFPPSITVRLVDPVLKVSIPNMHANQLAAEQDAAQAPQPVEIQWSFKGHADVITNHLNASYGLNLKGNDTMRMSMGDENVSVVGENSDYQFALKAKSLSDFLKWENLNPKDEAQMKALFASISEVSSNIGALNYKVEGTGEPAFTQELGKFQLSNRSTDELVDLDFEVLGKASQVHPAYGAFLEKLGMMGEAPPELAAMGLNEMPFSAARAGKQDFDMAASVYVTTSKDANAPRIVRVKAPRFMIKNNFYDMNLVVNMDATDSASGTDFTFLIDNKLNVTEAGATDMRKMMDTIFAMAPMMAQNNPAFDAEQFKAKVTEALPTVSTLGPITFVVDVSGKLAAKGEAAVAQKGTINVNRFDFSHARWGINAKGTMDNTAEAPAITLTLNCVKCDAMTADVMKSAVQGQEIQTMLDPKQPQFPLGDGMLASVNQLLASIGKKDAASGDIAFDVTTPAANDFRINDKPVAGVMMEAMTALAPYMAPAAPAGVEGADETMPQGLEEAPAN